LPLADRPTAGLELYNKFIKVGAQLELNISAEERSAMNSLFAANSPPGVRAASWMLSSAKGEEKNGAAYRQHEMEFEVLQEWNKDSDFGDSCTVHMPGGYSVPTALPGAEDNAVRTVPDAESTTEYYQTVHGLRRPSTAVGLDPKLTPFDGVKKTIERLIHTNSWRRFKASGIYMALVRELNDQKQGSSAKKLNDNK